MGLIRIVIMGVIVIAKGVGNLYCAAANADLLGMRAHAMGIMSGGFGPYIPPLLCELGIL